MRLGHHELTADDLDRLSVVGGGTVSVHPRRDGWELELGPVCGVLELDRVRLVVEPKVMADGAAVVTWLRYAAALPATHAGDRQWSVDAQGLRDVVVAALIDECAQLARHGLRRDYRRLRTEDVVLRGRLDIPRQIALRYGQVDRLHLHRFDRRADIWENVVCRSALDLAARSALSPRLRRAARELSESFPTDGTGPTAARLRLARARYHRMNEQYRGAHTWAGLLLGGGGVSDMLHAGPWRAGTLLVQMNRLWEAAVVRMVSTAGPAAGRTVLVEEESRQPRHFLADVVVRVGDRLVPVDAKNKDYTTEPPTRDDVHQLLTYAAAFDGSGPVPAAVLLHPTVGRPVRRMLGVSGPAGAVGRILLQGVDVSAAPRAGEAVVQGAVQQLHAEPIG